MQPLAISKCCQSGHSDEEKNTVMSRYSSSLAKFAKIVFQPKLFIKPIQYFLVCVCDLHFVCLRVSIRNVCVYKICE